jgi:hypothetical protein
MTKASIAAFAAFVLIAAQPAKITDDPFRQAERFGPLFKPSHSLFEKLEPVGVAQGARSVNHRLAPHPEHRDSAIGRVPAQ